MNSFFKNVISHLLKNAFEGHTKFSVADNTAVGANPIRSISLDAVPVNNDTLISLSWEGGEKLFEKTLSEQEASHQFDLISSDLAEVSALTKQGQYDAAKDLMKKLGQKYAENTGDIVDTNLPKLHNTQADMDPERAYEVAMDGLDRKLMRGLIHQEEYDIEVEKLNNRLFPNEKSLYRQAKITMQNLWFSTTDELLEYQEKQKGAKGGSDQDHIPLWDAQKGKGTAPKDELAPPSMSYEDLEKSKERDHEDMQKHIDEKIKTELESALQEKAASVFGPDQVELVKVLKKNGRNWDEIKKILIKDFNFDKDSVNIFVDEQRESLDPTGINVEPVKEDIDVDVKEKSPLTPPEDLVSPDTHDKLLKDHEDKKKDKSPLKEDKDLNFTPKDVMDIPEGDEIEEQSSAVNEIARADNDDIHKMANASSSSAIADEKARERVKQIFESTGRKVSPDEFRNIFEEEYTKETKKYSSLKQAANDLNPLQEPLQEKPTTPSQDTVPMNKPLDHDAPQKGDRVFVSSDLADEKAGFEGMFISTYKSKGMDFSIVETDAGDLLDVESHRVTKTSEGSGAQDTEPVMEPQITQQQPDNEIPVTPKMDDLHTSSQKKLMAIKAEVEILLREVDGMGKTSYKFVKQGLEKHASDSAFEGNGWCRVWVTDDEVAADAKYAEALKLPDETARIEALKEIARNIAHESLRMADSSGAKVGVQSWFDSLSPSDHDRIDWVALASPKSSEDEDLEFEREQGRKYGPDAILPEFRDQVNPKSSLEPKVEKKADASDDYVNSLPSREPELPKEHVCTQCNKPMGYNGFINDVCPSCVRKNHKKVTGSESEKEAGMVDWKCPKCGNTASVSSVYDEKICMKDGCGTKMEKQASDFEKGISQNKTADEPEVAPKTQFKDYKIKPKYVPGTEAVPATPEMDEVLSKMEVLEQNLATLEAARKQIQAKMKEELAKIDQTGDRVGMEAELQASIEKAGILISAVESKVISWKDKFYTMQTEEVSYVPSVTPKEMLEKIYAKFSGAEKYVQDVLNGMLSQAKNVMQNTVIRWPNKRSELNKEASIIDEMNNMNAELLEALKLLSEPI